MSTDVRDFIQASVNEICGGNALLTEEQVRKRWPMVSQRAFRGLVNGKHSSGVQLPAVQFSQKERGFRMADVIGVELRLWTQSTDCAISGAE